jgi:hypothetical protein
LSNAAIWLVGSSALRPARQCRDPFRQGETSTWQPVRTRKAFDYLQRAATAETVNADAKAHRGLDALAVRGLEKAAGSAMLFALTNNILRVITIGG